MKIQRKKIPKFIRKIIGYVLGLHYYYFGRQNKTEIHNSVVHALSIVLHSILIRCYCTDRERSMLVISSCIEVHETAWADMPSSQHIMILTVNFDLFMYLCINEEFPKDYNIKLK